MSGAVAAGLFACAVLMVNNIRDIPTDRLSGKRTLAVLAGPAVSRAIYTGFVLIPFGIAVILALFYPLAWLTLFVLLMILPAILITLTAKTAKELILALQLTSKDHNGYPSPCGRRRWVDIGSGAWDRQGRPSEVRVDRVVRVDPKAVRREGAVLSRQRFDAVARAVADLHR